MKRIFLSASLAVSLSACAGGLPPTTGNGLGAFDVIFGLKKVPDGADNSRVWSPVHQIYGGKPTWSLVWFKEKPKDGVAYELTAKAPGDMEKKKTDAAETKIPKESDGIIETASLYVGEVKNWFGGLISVFKD